MVKVGINYDSQKRTIGEWKIPVLGRLLYETMTRVVLVGRVDEVDSGRPQRDVYKRQEQEQSTLRD